MDSDTRDKIIDNIERLLRAFEGQLPSDNIMDSKELLEHGEWGEAYDLVCTQLYELDVALTDELYRVIETTGMAMDLDSRHWTYLGKLVDQGSSRTE